MYIWEKYRTFEITSGIIFKMNLPLYKGFTLEITNKWWPLTTLNRWPLYRFKIYSKMHRESTKVTVMSRWPLWAGDHYEQVTIMQRWPLWAGDHYTKVTITAGLTVYCVMMFKGAISWYNFLYDFSFKNTFDKVHIVWT